VRSAVLDNHRITIREFSDELGLSFGSVHSILTDDLGTKRVSAKFVPRTANSRAEIDSPCSRQRFDAVC
jgi:hypothetical protein